MKTNLQEVLACPKCQGAIKLENSMITCLNCNRSYPISHGIIDLRTGITKRGNWDLNVFESAYRDKGFYKDVYEYAELDKIPRIAEAFRYSRVKGRVVKLLKPLANSLILDLGSGNGYFIFDVLAHYLGQDIAFIGLDIAEPNIERLNYRVKEEHQENIIGLLGEAENLPFNDGIFDIVICSEVIEHLFNPEQAIKHMYRSLKKGGRLFITTPARPVTDFWNTLFWLPVKIVRFLKRKPFPKLAYDQPLDKKRLLNHLVKAGFNITRFEQNAIMPHESYVAKTPPMLVNLMIKITEWAELRFNRLISFAGLHYLIECKK